MAAMADLKKMLKLVVFGKVIMFVLQSTDTAKRFFFFSFRFHDRLYRFVMCVFLSAEGKRTMLKEEAGENQCSAPIRSHKETELAD